MKEFDGFLYYKLHAMYSKNEGPDYYLQTEEEKDYFLITEKMPEPWDENKMLEPFVGEKVDIKGELKEGKIETENKSVILVKEIKKRDS